MIEHAQSGAHPGDGPKADVPDIVVILHGGLVYDVVAKDHGLKYSVLDMDLEGIDADEAFVNVEPGKEGFISRSDIATGNPDLLDRVGETNRHGFSRAHWKRNLKPGMEVTHTTTRPSFPSGESVEMDTLRTIGAISYVCEPGHASIRWVDRDDAELVDLKDIR